MSSFNIIPRPSGPRHYQHHRPGEVHVVVSRDRRTVELVRVPAERVRVRLSRPAALPPGVSGRAVVQHTTGVTA